MSMKITKRTKSIDGDECFHWPDFSFLFFILRRYKFLIYKFNHLLRNVVKWSGTLQKYCGICYKIFEVCLIIL